MMRGRVRAGRGALALLALLALLGACARAEPTAELSEPARATSTPVVTTVPVDPAIEALMVGAGMTEQARRLFLQTSPTIEDNATLAQTCRGVDAAGQPGNSHTYGCLADGRIHIRSFSVPEMRELSYVVAAHELLHVVYRRMTAAERARIDAELDAARAGNGILEARLEVYTTVAEDSLNEVHSIVGTEFAELSSVLEEHYGAYFDRGRILGAFQRTLGEREEVIRALEATVSDTEAQIESLEARMDAYRAAGDLRSYNANVPVVNALVAEHNAALRELRQRVDEYNQLLAS